MSGPRISLVVNPAANRGAAATVASRVAELLARGAEVRVLAGSSQAESVSLLARAADRADAVIVCGGDGIAHLAANALAEGEVPLGIIPAGSGNDAAIALGMPADPVRAAETLLAALRAGSVARVDLGHCAVDPALSDGHGQPHEIPPVAPAASGRWWLTMCYGGFDSAVNERANRMRWPAGPRRYDVAIGLEMLRLRSHRVRLGLDDGAALELPVTLVAIGNAPQYGGGKRMTPDAKMDDGIFDVTVVGPVSRLTLARLAPTLPRAGHIGHPAVSQYRAKEVWLAGDGVIAYADGERLAPLPIRTRCVPAALPVLVPPDGPVPPGLTSLPAPS
ncbi:MAG TPA: diacylglycerol kinase family protein [Jatrophihabitans sp.]|nr:diacylglycerol kinase family protein [Jatrophihabitans sp.]